MKELFDGTLNQLAGKSFDCTCGRTHVIDTQILVVEKGALDKVLQNDLPGTPFVIADQNTWPLGERVLGHLPHHILTGQDIHADDYNLGRMLIETSQKDIGYFIALGAGTIGDLVRFLSYRLGKPFVNVCTAPSMDGAASSHSPLVHNNFKATYQAAPPYAVYFDLDIMASAPGKMIAAGFADVMGKYVAAVDWEIGNLATGEHFCHQIKALTLRAVNKCEESCDGLAERKPQAIETLAKALLLSSLAMQLNITSRPASGMEHLLSHSWENQSLQRGKPVSLHGDKVGIGTLIACDIYHEFFLEKRLPRGEVKGIDYQNILDHWEDLRKESDFLWSNKDRIAYQIQQAGGPTRPAQLGISPADVALGLERMTVGRPRVTIAHVIEALGLQQDIYGKVLPHWVD